MKKYIIAGVSIIIIATAVLVWVMRKPAPQKQTNQNNYPLSKYSYTDYKKETVVDGFPDGLLYGQTKIIESFTVNTKEGGIQHTVKYQTDKKGVDVYNYYTKYLQEQGYKLHVEKTGLAYSIQAEKNDQIVNLTASELTAQKITNVIISHIQTNDK